MLGSAGKRAEVGDGKFSAVVGGRGVSMESLVVFEIVGNRAFVFFHFARHHTDIAAIVDNAVPLVFEHLLGLHVLGINHQAAGVSVKAVHYVGIAFLAGLCEIVVKYGFDVGRRTADRHGQDTRCLFDDHEVSVFVDQFDMAASEKVVALVLADADAHAGFQRIVKLSDRFAVYLDAPALQCGFQFGAALSFNIAEKPFQQRCFVLDGIVFVIGWFVDAVFHALLFLTAKLRLFTELCHLLSVFAT